MFTLFKKKEINLSAAESFWNWFIQQENWIIENINTNGMDVIWAVDAQIKPVFPYFKKELEFQMGYNEDRGEFFFFHFGNKDLMRDSQILKDMMPAELSGRWSFTSER